MTPLALPSHNRPQDTARLTVTVSQHHSVRLTRSRDPVTGDLTIGEGSCVASTQIVNTI